ncbi:hypothetical protein BTM25_47990 [Actinomadura rubteroloni]|uniref:Uncharacterized protein n=1 Tax=Actinomadura rubteroloni TaxID=1926885 RepID=A0A2P4UF05_9ACTN|nr:hypothetical protein BTM25_47990 [Actinomadura rubteroloni]
MKGDPRLSVKMVDDRGLVYLEVTEPTRDNTVEVGADFIDGQWMFIRREDGFRMGHAMDCFGATRIIQIVLGLG